jgi:transposase-like protein
LIVEEREGRKLLSDEIIHHVDGDPLNNRPENLVILTRAEHMRLHMAGRIVNKWTVDERVRAVDLYTSGLSIDEVARAMGRPYSSTRQVLERAGVTRTPAETRALRRRATANN